jgi:predicted Zn-dependent protease
MQLLSPVRASLLAAAVLACGAASAAGIYEPVPIRDNEQHLIQESNELEGYFAAHGLLLRDEKVVSLVRRIGHEIRPAPSDDYIEYEFFVLRDPSPNAFALPNGHVYVHTGMLARLRDEDQLAGLLAHEINHVAGHHGIVDHRATRGAAIAGMVLAGVGGGWGSLISIGLQTSVYGFGRDLEQEADDRAVQVLSSSRYDPHALPELFAILGTDYEGLEPRVPAIWSTHPEIRARAETSRTLVATLPKRERHVAGFEAAIFDVQTMTVQDYVEDDYPRTALALAETLVQAYPDDPRLLNLVGDAWQGMGAQTRIDDAELKNSDKRQNRRDRAKRTREQRLAELLKTEAGRQAYADNLARAESTYLRVIEMDPTYARPYRGLGEVYEPLQRARDAADAYVKYVRLAPDAPDRTIVVGRLKTLAAKLKETE